MSSQRKKTDPDDNRIDALVNRLQQEGRIDVLESELARFDPAALEDAEKESWFHLYGIAAYRQGDRPLAFERFQEGVRQFPDSGSLRFSLGQEHEFRGEIDRMVACFDRAMFPKVPPQYALAEARYAYLWNRTDKAWSYAAALMPVYFDLKILDTTFLHIRGLPSFQQVWAYLAAFSQLEGDFERLDDLTRRAETECQDLDFVYLKAELEGFRSGDFTLLKEKLRGSIQESKTNHFPYGYQAMRLGILLAQETDDGREADQLLDGVTLMEKDFPWLEDMRLLARCENANRIGDGRDEASLRRQFLDRQPMLFEPDNAVKFNLLEYQEKLKPGYQRTRSGHG